MVGSMLLGADEMIAAMVAARIPHLRRQMEGQVPWDKYRALGVVRNGTLLGGVVYHDYQGFDIQMTCAFDRVGWALPATLRAIFAYPFLDLRCRRVSAVNGRKNKKARKMTERLGFTMVGVARRGLDGFEDAFLWEMLKEDCKWIRDRSHGQEVACAPAAA